MESDFILVTINTGNLAIEASWLYSDTSKHVCMYKYTCENGATINNYPLSQ